MPRQLITDDLLDRAGTARAAGRGDAAARLYDDAIDEYRRIGDLDGWIRAALGAASVYVFGAEPGRLPARLHEVLQQAHDPVDRARLTAELARCWVYAGHAERAVSFAEEAVAVAAGTNRPQLLADCLDAALAAHWGPDDLRTRVDLAGRLDAVAAHVVDPDARLQARLWGLQVGCEGLDLPAIHRHMRALELLGEESPRARFFAASRRLMLDLLRGRTDTADELIRVAAAAGQEASLADAWMVVESMKGYTGVQAGDRLTAARVAAECEQFGTAEGATAVCAEAACLWAAADRPDRAAAVLDQFDPGLLERLPRDVNWLLTLQCVLESALTIDRTELIATASRLLTPYAGRAVFNAGAVMFHGVTDDTLARSAAAMDDPATAAHLAARALATYRRIGAGWWEDRLSMARQRGSPHGSVPASSAAGDRRIVHLHPAADGLWLIGAVGAETTVRSLRGFHHLRELLRRPGLMIAATELAAVGPTVVQAGIGELADRQALLAYRARLRELDAELTEADAWADLGRASSLRAERAALLAEVGSVTGLAGRARTVGATQERARVAVTKAVATALDRITAVDGPTGRHLRATIRTGTYCSYQPDPDVAIGWILDE